MWRCGVITARLRPVRAGLCNHSEWTQGTKPAVIKERPMLWCGSYLIIATVVAMATFLAAQWFREEHVAAPDCSGVMSAVAGMLWPVLLVGMTELAVFWWAIRGARYAP